MIHAIPNGGARNPVVAAKLKLEGVVKGIPDLFVPEWSLWIEMKAEDGRESLEQKQIGEYLVKTCGHLRFVAFSCDHAKQLVTSLRS